MVTKIERLKVYLKNKFLAHAYIFLSKVFAVLFSSAILLLMLGLLDYDYTLKNFFSCMAIYFVFEELKPFLYKLRGYKQ